MNLAKYVWKKRGLNCLVCHGVAEISRPGVKKPWVAMVRRNSNLNDGSSWGLMREGENIRRFQSAKEAMEAVESYIDSYLESFCQYHSLFSDNSLEINKETEIIDASEASRPLIPG